MGVFRFPHAWSALAARSQAIEPIVAELDDRDRALEDYLQLVCPVGKIDTFAGSEAPNGWLLCDGSGVSRSQYSNLFTALGTTFGAGDGSTTFNIPDLRDRMPIGKSGTKALGATGGSANAAAVTHDHSHDHATGNPAQLHQHSLAANGGRFVTDGAAGGGGVGYVEYGVVAGSDYVFRAVNNTAGDSGFAHDHGATDTDATSAGSSGTGANVPPYLALNFIIRH